VAEGLSFEGTLTFAGGPRHEALAGRIDRPDRGGDWRLRSWPGAGVWVGTEIQIPEPIEISAGSARARFQGGRQVSGVDRFEPYCELEIDTVSEAPQWSSTGGFRVIGERYSLLRDPITRIPALITGFSCSDPLFQESIWRLDGTAGSNLHSLRCVVAYFDCRIGPPLTLPQAQTVVGPRIRLFDGPGS
jgi:hypothetical protein